VGGTLADPGAAALVVEDVSIAFGGLLALDAVSLRVEPGEVVGVIGPNGAGKTTLFNVVSGFVTPSEGRIAIGGRTMRRLHPHQLARLRVGRTLQGVGLWPQLTVLENVMAGAQVTSRAGLGSALLGLWRSSRDEDRLAARAHEALAQLRVDDVAGRLPSTLPYATQKRVALARALVGQPTLLLLDEPASGLSDAELDELGGLLHELAHRMAIVLVEHHMDLVMAVCDRVVVLDAGRVIASGTPDEVKADPAVTAAYLGDLDAASSGSARTGGDAGC